MPAAAPVFRFVGVGSEYIAAQVTCRVPEELGLRFADEKAGDEKMIFASSQLPEEMHQLLLELVQSHVKKTMDPATRFKVLCNSSDQICRIAKV